MAGEGAAGYSAIEVVADQIDDHEVFGFFFGCAEEARRIGESEMGLFMDGAFHGCHREGK